ncbi:MAG TPA: protein kinase [Streptosporangiaceae bacterium]|nr:protein kinase [Streptosporangiaceae bacterium]
MASKPLEPGDPLRLGRFELLARLGQGGQGVVYLGRGPGPGEERVAVKVLRSSVDGMELQRLGRELDAIHQVQPFVTARVIEAAAEGDRRYVVSEFIDGPSLLERVEARGPLPEGELQRLAVGTATALTAIHGAGVVHRDFKPANVLLGPDGPRVVDFGIARLVDAGTVTTGVIGTPSFMAPEQLAGARPGSAVDIFAWAVTMVFAATGRSPFGSGAVQAVMWRIMSDEPDLGGVPPSLLPVVRQCLDKDPGRRPVARDLLLRLVDPSAQGSAVPSASPPYPAYPAAMADATGPAPATVGPTFPSDLPAGPTAPRRISGRSRRGPILAIGAAAVVAALIIGGVLFLTRPSSPGHPAATGSSGAGHPTSPGALHTSTPPPATQVAVPAIPAAFAGTWTGTATLAPLGASSGTISNPITFTLAAGGHTAREVNLDCVNVLTLTRTTTAVLTFSEPQTPHCQAGAVTFTRRGPGLAYHWLDIAGLAQNTAILHKS